MKNKLRARRKELNLTQTKISEILGITRQSYNHYELGARNIPFAIVVRLKKILKTQDDEIFLDDTQTEDIIDDEECTA